jgi:hypothetical protein
MLSLINNLKKLAICLRMLKMKSINKLRFFFVLSATIIISSNLFCMEPAYKLLSKPLSYVYTKIPDLQTIKEYIANYFNEENKLTKYDISKEILKDDIYLQYNEKLKTAVAVFKMPEQSEIAPLTEEQSAKAMDLLRVYKVENINGYCSIMFDYDNAAILPESKEQAVLMLLVPRLKDAYATANSEAASKSLELLNDQQKAALANEQQAIQKEKESGKAEKETQNLSRKIASKELLNQLQINLKTKDKEITSQLNVFHATVDHYLSGISASRNFNQQVLFANIIALMAERMAGILSGASFPDLADQNTKELAENILNKAFQIALAIDPLAMNQFIANPDVQDAEMATLSHLLADLELRTVFSNSEGFKGSVEAWKNQLEQALTDTFTGKENATYAGFSLDQIITLMSDSCLRGIQRQYSDALFIENKKADLELVSVLGEDFALDVIKDYEKLYIRYFHTTFKSDIIDQNGKLRGAEEYNKILSNQFDQVRVRAEQEGFVIGTFVKTDGNYQRIEDIQSGQLITSYDIRNKNQTERKVINVYKESVERYIQITLDSMVINAAFDQKFYIPSNNIWVTAYELSESKELQQHFPSKILDIKAVLEQADICKLTVETDHNFYVTKNDITAHNFVPVFVGVAYVIGSGVATLFVSGVGTAIAVWLAEKVFRRNPRIEQPNSQMPNPQMPEDPDKQKEEWKKIREQWKPLTNKKAREKAKELGYEEKKPDFKTENKIAFYSKKKNDWISPDAYGHKGGVWKKFDRNGDRIGTFNITLKIEIGT